MAKRKQPVAAVQPPITIRGARTHNLKGVDCIIPAHQMTVITGVSGSGKSSLAFDTLFAEGQRRYVESLSTYARQFIARMPRPDVDAIENIPPAIALEQKNSVRNARSTIGTATEINDYLRLLFAKVGRVFCPQSGEEARRDSPSTAAARLLEVWPGEAVYLLAPIRLKNPELAESAARELVRQGFTRLMQGEEQVDIDDPTFTLAPTQELRVVVDRLVLRSEDRARLAEALESCFRLAGGRCVVRRRSGGERLFSEELRCNACPGDCGVVLREPSVALLNFSSPLGACVTCQGFGRVTGRDWGKIIPNPRLSISEGAVAPWNGESGQECVRDLRRHAKRLNIRMDVPWQDLSERERKLVREGDGGEWYGIDGFFAWLEERRYKVQSRIMIARYRGFTDCPDCHGWRLKPEALSIRLNGLNIGQVCDMTVKDAAAWFATLPLTREEQEIAERPLGEVRARLDYLLQVGLGYLTLSRQTRTLSGGESQRINLATSLGSALTDTLYVLDEPTVGLHPRDTQRLVGVLQRLKLLGNTLVVVEHDVDVMRAAEHLVDIGPAAGEAGGEVLYIGSPGDIAAARGRSRTADYLAGTNGKRAKASTPAAALGRHGRRAPTAWLAVNGASENNLKHISVRFPLGVLCCVTGVSGSGKSTLVHKCLYENYRRDFESDISVEPGSILGLEGTEKISDMILVDQSPIGRSTRSNAATYLKAYDEIRNLLADAPHAQALGLKPRDFSFNVEGGRCETCEGTGMQTIDMHFLADVQVICETCEGRRFKDHVLEVELNGLNVSGILDLTVNEALKVFADHAKVLGGLRPLARVGLGYLRLGQSTATLSGGEAQRLKLAAHLAEGKKNALLIFDEPTTGLHPSDLDVLLEVFQRLVDDGTSLLVIEHNLQLIRRADYVIDMGPEGGEEGGRVVAEGTPEDVAANPDSLTGRFLAESSRPVAGSMK